MTRTVTMTRTVLTRRQRSITSGQEYMLGYPCDTPIVLAYFNKNDELCAVIEREMQAHTGDGDDKLKTEDSVSLACKHISHRLLFNLQTY